MGHWKAAVGCSALDCYLEVVGEGSTRARVLIYSLYFVDTAARSGTLKAYQGFIRNYLFLVLFKYCSNIS